MTATDRKIWISVLVVIGVSAFFIGCASPKVRTDSQLIESLKQALDDERDISNAERANAANWMQKWWECADLTENEKVDTETPTEDK